MIFVQADSQPLRHFRVLGLAPGLVLDLLDRPRYFPRLAVHRARRPVETADLIQHGATDPDPGIGAEAGALAGIVLASGFQQADHAGLDQVVDLDRSWQPGGHVVGDALDQRGVLYHQVVAALTLHLDVHRMRIHGAAPPVCKLYWIRRSTKNSRCPSAAVGSGHFSTRRASSAKAREAGALG